MKYCAFLIAFDWNCLHEFVKLCLWDIAGSGIWQWSEPKRRRAETFLTIQNNFGFYGAGQLPDPLPNHLLQYKMWKIEQNHNGDGGI